MTRSESLRIIQTVAEMQQISSDWRAEDVRIGFVPTMGYLHEGHLSLVRQARLENDRVVVSIYVNPTQFGPNEDFERYPRDLERDRRMAEEAGTDVLFVPTDDEMYPEGHATFVEVERLTHGLCGKFRPGHFRGVTTVVAKLFLAVMPHRAYFGMKDYQQMVVIRRMTRDLLFPIEVVACPIVREPDGLAMSSRNEYLSDEDRRRAPALAAALRASESLFRAGERRAPELISAARSVLEEADIIPQYLELVDANSLERIAIVKRPAVLAVAAYLGQTRLIDNVLLTPESTASDRPEPSPFTQLTDEKE